MAKECAPKKEGFFKKWGVVFVLSLALAIILIDATLLNVSLKTLVNDLKTDVQSIQWVITAYSLTLAALTITGGRLGDLFGRKRMFVTGAVLFAIGSFIASISHNISMMIIGESIIEGVGAALMMPATASLLISKYKGKDRTIAFGLWGGVAGAATAIGPLLGGWLTTNYSWRWGFRINVFVALILVIGSVLITECRDKEEKPILDWKGVVLSSAGLLSVVFAIIESSKYGWFKAKGAFMALGQNWCFGGYSVSFYALILGIMLLVGFFLLERRSEKKGETPLVSLSLFKNRQFVSGALTTAIMSLGQAGLIFSIPIFMQSVRGANAFETGMALLPLSVTAFFVSPIASVLSHKIGTPKRYIQLGLLSNAVGYYILANGLNVTSTAADLRLGLIFMGAGMGLIMGQISNVTLSAVSPQQSGEASGVNNTLRQIGSTLGTAVIGAVLLTTVSSSLVSGVEKSTKIPEFVKPIVAEEVSKQAGSVEFGGSGANTQGSPSMGLELKRIVNDAVVAGNKEALWYALWFSVIGFGTSFLLPGGRNIEKEETLAVKH